MLGPDETRLGEVRLAQRSMRDARRIDGVGLAVGARRGTCSGHHLGRYADHALTTGEQVALKPARDVATVLDGEEARGAESARPGQQLVMPARIAADRLLGDAAAPDLLDTSLYSISVREKGQSWQRRTHSPRVTSSPWGHSLRGSAGALPASVRWR